jgi:hypothetical protein
VQDRDGWRRATREALTVLVSEEEGEEEKKKKKKKIDVNLQVLQFCPVSITPPMLPAHLYLNIVLIRRTSRQNIGNFKT